MFVLSCQPLWFRLTIGVNEKHKQIWDQARGTMPQQSDYNTAAPRLLPLILPMLWWTANGLDGGQPMDLMG
jgi:hypothetical protein